MAALPNQNRQVPLLPKLLPTHRPCREENNQVPTSEERRCKESVNETSRRRAVLREWVDGCWIRLHTRRGQHCNSSRITRVRTSLGEVTPAMVSSNND